MSSYNRRVALFYLKSRTDKKKGPKSRTNPTKASWELANIRYRVLVKEETEYKERLHPVLNLGSQHWTVTVSEGYIRQMVNLEHGDDMTRWQAAVHLGDISNVNPRKLVNLMKTYDENNHRILNVFDIFLFSFILIFLADFHWFSRRLGSAWLSLVWLASACLGSG